MKLIDRIKVITGNFQDATAGPSEKLIKAIPTEQIDAEYFSALTEEWNSILFRLKENELPEHITIVCPTKEIRDYYMMVYNYWHATGKEDRLMSEEWE